MMHHIKDVSKMDIASRNSTGNSLSFYKCQMDENFLKAAKAGDLKTVIECLSNGVQPDVCNPGGLNILHFAARENHPEICRVALKHGVDIKATTKRLNTALHIASLGGHTEVAKILIEHGAPVNLQAKDDITPLYMAAQENHNDTLQLLLDYGANPQIAARGGFEPVDIAVQQGHLKAVEMLLEKEAKQGMKAMHQAAKKDDKAALKLLIDADHSVSVRAPNGYTPLHVAAKFGSVNAANYLIDHGADLNTGAKHNVAPIHVASRHGQMASISVLIDAGANLGIATKDGLTALHCAARDGHDRCVELLLVHSAPITAKTKHGLTALHMASQGNHTTSANYLLTNGAHIDDVTADGVTSLHVTAHYGQVETAQLLLEKGASIDQRALNGYTALHVASKKNREGIVQLLLKHKCSVHIKNNNGQTALHVATFFGHVNIVLLLLQAGASLEAVTIREETVLHIACRTIQIQIVRLLIRNNAKINAKTRDGETPLHIACRQGSNSLVSLLLDNYADPNDVNKEGSGALHIAARDGQVEIADSLIDHNADVNLQSERGFTPLHEAAKNGNSAIVQTLLDKKANVNASGKNGLTPLHIACHYDQPEVATLLLNNGADIHAQAKNGFTPLHIAAKKSQINICTLLFDRGAEADITTRYGLSPLHLAAKEGNLQVVDMLLEHGASPSIQTTNGLSPLHVAVHYNQIEVVKRLLKYSSGIINSTTQTGFTPLHLAASYGHVEMAELLLQNGANVEAKTKPGNTPLHLATVKGHQEIVELLLKYNAAPNAMNKEGYTALYLAEITQQVVIIQVLKRVTKVVVKKDTSDENTPGAKRWEKIRHVFLNPEALEETLLIEAGDEAEDTSHHEKKGTEEDFEESFAGLEDTKSEHNSPAHQIIEETEISVTEQHQVESMVQDHDSFLDSLDGEPGSDGGVRLYNGHDEVPDKKNLTNGYVYTKRTLVERDYQKIISEKSFLSGPPKQGSFLVSFNVDARGATMESKQSGIKVTLPPGACEMPTRITLRLRKTEGLPANLSLLPQECLASRVIHMSPENMQFLKPVTLEIPHVAALKGKERELTVMKLDSGHSRWKELPLDENAWKAPGHLTVILQEVPEKLVLVSRPLKERFVMNPSGGEIQSASMPEVSIVFPPQTLNTTTKVILQTQPVEHSVKNLEDSTTSFGPIVSLDPPTKLSKPININVPCPKEATTDGKLHLLAWLPTDAKSSAHSVRSVDCMWRNITETTPLSIVGNNIMFSTTEFTRYWVVKTPDIDSVLPRIAQLEETVSVVPYTAQCIIFGRLLSPKEGELRICLVTDEFSQKSLVEPSEGFTELARSQKIPTYRGQTLNIRLGEDLNSTVSSLHSKITFQPFNLNVLQMRVELTHAPAERPVQGVISLVNDNVGKNEAQFCFMDVVFGPEMLTMQKVEYPEDTVNDDVISMVGQQTADNWFPLADELCMSNRDKQAVIDISSGKYDVPSIRLLEYWRSKNPSDAIYKNLYDALKRAENHPLAENVYNASPNEISREIQPRPQSVTRHYSVSPTFDPARRSNKTSVDTSAHSPTPHVDEDKDDDAHYYVSPVPSNDRLTPLESPTPVIEKGNEPSVDSFVIEDPPPVLDEINREAKSSGEVEKSPCDHDNETVDDNDDPCSNYSRERWSTAANYAPDTPEDDIDDISFGEEGKTPYSPASATSEMSDTVKEPFDGLIETPRDVSPTFTPHSFSPDIDDDVTEEENFIGTIPEFDFASLEQLNDGEEISDMPATETHEPSAYELSIQRKQMEEEEEWEQQHAQKPNNPSIEPVAEDCIVDEKQKPVESEVDFSAFEEEDSNATPVEITKEATVVPESTTDDQATPCFDLPPSHDRPRYEEKLISAPTYEPEVQSYPDGYEEELESQVSPVDTPSQYSAPENAFGSLSTDSEFPSSEISGSLVPNDSSVEGYEDSEGSFIVSYHDDGQIVTHDDGFTKVTKATTVMESVTVTTKSEVREVSAEELQDLLAQQQQQVGDNTVITNSVSREVQLISGDAGNNNNIDVGTVIVVKKSNTVEVTNDVDIKSMRTKETQENISAVEIALNPDEENMSGEELIQKMFGNQDNVLEFFKGDGEPPAAIEDKHNDVGKVDEYGTQV